MIILIGVYMDKTNKNQSFLFGEESIGNDVNQEWDNMPEYNNVKQPPPEIIAEFKFRNQTDFEEFKSKIKDSVYNGERVFNGMQGKKKKQAWYPLLEKASIWEYGYTHNINPRFPIYIVSKGRWKRNPTSRELDKMNVPYYMIVEEQEYEKYSLLIDKRKLLILPMEYKKNYDTFWKDTDLRTGPGPARNFAWDHSIKQGADWHWVMDDNIESFERFNNNLKVKCTSGNLFYVCEDFVLRYKNIAQAGLNYKIFCPAYEARPPIRLNTRIYSCLLIRNDIPYRWRGRYNEDTDLSLRLLKDGWCTVQFNAFLQGKRATQTVKGGNSAEFYDKEGTRNKSQMLVDMHPDVTKLVWKFNRWHHDVNYSPYKKNTLIRKENINIPSGINNFGMELKKRDI